MPVAVNLSLDPETAADEGIVAKLAAKAAGFEHSGISDIRIIRKSVDARQRKIKINISVEVFQKGEIVNPVIRPFENKDVSSSREIIIIGAGPAGLFAALRLIEMGLKPVIFERGRDVSARKRDIAKISREHIVDPDSNYCFGEGGAGTFSDGKLYTRSKKRGDNTRVLELLCLHGASDKILYEAHPHLGTDRLPGIISEIRNTIINSGGEIHFGKRVIEIIAAAGRFRGVRMTGGESIHSTSLILATGHSARDIYEMCISSGILLEKKSFAVGVRAEHPQELIDNIRYHGTPRRHILPVAAYTLVRQVEGRGVYSFCMCPGGFIVPSATLQEEVVVNGMSPSGRNSPFANSGIVVEVRDEDIEGYSKFGVLAGIQFQKELENNAWINGGKTQRAPAQRITDFIRGKASSTLPRSSYFPGTTSSPLNEWLPEGIASRLREGFRQFEGLMKGYITDEAMILGVETRTSSPVRISRDIQTLMSTSIQGIYPCGEGSGYSGGIVSSAVDGMNVAEAVARNQ